MRTTVHFCEDVEAAIKELKKGPSHGISKIPADASQADEEATIDASLTDMEYRRIDYPMDSFNGDHIQN